MKTLVRFAAVLGIAWIAAACAPLSGQFLADYDLGTRSGGPQSSPEGGQGLVPQFLHLDLTTESEYADHKDELKGLADLAVIGKLSNTGGSDLTLEMFITAGDTGPLSDSEVRAQGTRLWGPKTVGAGATDVIGWDESAELFGPGKTVLIDEAKGDGEFTLYLLATGSTYTLEEGHLILVLNAGI